ncbi:hypothetical protein JM946_11635 [Steroidobacter sp. S1-65]|uniref:ABC transporter permease n=1 Tax=Steroidobacter gossypii TaxID=2805490 RepID=A0ABS1WWP7_9GAMM|nr:hypothetical protein [Steroidobacter gossypii]MBM0105406.1 hypothetical protein [Steroidobacter gossypii]
MATQSPASLTHLPAVASAFLRTHPVLLAEWLQLLSWLSRWREKGARAAVLAGSVAVVAGLLLVTFSLHASELIGRVAPYWMLIAAVAAIASWTTVSRRRRRFEEAQSQSWLIAAPISASSVRLSIAIRTFLPLVVSFVAVAVCLIAGALPGGAAGSDLGRLVAALSAGALIGCIAGWSLVGRGSKLGAVVASRYVPAPRLRTKDLPMRPGADGLARWPIAQVLSWSRPENSRYVLIIALLAVQGGSSAMAGLSVVAMYFLASYLGALLLAIATVAKAAASWLRPTPMTLGDFVWCLCCHAFLHQLAGTALAAILMCLLGAPVAMSLQAAALWLGLVILVSGAALIQRYRGHGC